MSSHLKTLAEDVWSIVHQAEEAWDIASDADRKAFVAAAIAIDEIAEDLSTPEGDGEEEAQPVPEEDWPVHAAHCCNVHGCKYSSDAPSQCPVELSLIEREKNAGWCQEPGLVEDPAACRNHGEEGAYPPVGLGNQLSDEATATAKSQRKGGF